MTNRNLWGRRRQISMASSRKPVREEAPAGPLTGSAGAFSDISQKRIADLTPSANSKRFSTACHRANNQEGFDAFENCSGERRLRGVEGEVFFAGEEADEGAAFLGDVVA